MNKIKRYNDLHNEELALEFIKALESSLNESDKPEENYVNIQNKIISDLKLNFRLIGTFGAGIGSFYPIVDSIMKNTPIEVEKTPEIIVMMTITAISIIFLEERKFRNEKEEESITNDSKSLLEELKMRGVGNGIVKKLIKSLKSIKSIFYLITKHLGAVVGGFIDMFAYTSMLIPIMNGVLYLIGKYELNLETLTQNFIGLGVGFGTIIAKHGIVDLIKKIKSKLGIGDKVAKDVIDEVETPIIQKFGDMTFGDATTPENGDLIKEQ
jgi:hypothetical protein